MKRLLTMSLLIGGSLLFSCSGKKEEVKPLIDKVDYGKIWKQDYNVTLPPGVSPTKYLTKSYTIVGDSVEIIGVFDNPVIIYLPANKVEFDKIQNNIVNGYYPVESLKSYGAVHLKPYSNSFKNVDSVTVNPNGVTVNPALKSSFSINKIETINGLKLVTGQAMVYTIVNNKTSYYSIQYVVSIDNFK